jgi:hypothetical protein
MHPTIFEYLTPTDDQLATMNNMRVAFAELAAQIDEQVPDGPDKTFVLRTLRTAAMWANIAITRHPDGAPRD